MPFAKAIQIAALVLLLFKIPFVRAWPPTEEQKEKWKKIIHDGTNVELQQYVDELKACGEDIRQWFLIGTDDDNQKYRSLVRAAGLGASEPVQLLINHGADLQRNYDKPDDCQITPLVAACQRGHTEVVEKLLASGADVNAEALLFPPVFAAVIARQITTAHQLLQAGGNPSKLSLYGTSALHHAAEFGWLDFVLLLLEHGANVEGEDPDAPPDRLRKLIMRAYVRAERSKQAKEKGENILTGSPLNKAAVNGHIEIASELMKRGADVSKVEALGRAALQQIYPANSGISANFLQFYNPAAWETFTPKLQKKLKQLKLGYAPSTTPLINQGVLLVTLDIPPHIHLLDRSNHKVTRIEMFILTPDLIKVGETSERHKNVKHFILLTGVISSQRTPWIEFQFPEGQPDMLGLMAWAERLGARLDEVGYYLNAHHELILNDYSSDYGGTRYRDRKSARGSIAYSKGRGAPLYILDAKKGFIETTHEEEMAKLLAEMASGDGAFMEKAGEITSSTPLKQYWGDKKVPSDPVIIENTIKAMWQLQASGKPPIPYNLPIHDYIMEQLLDWHRPQLARLVNAALEDHPELKRKALEKGVNLFCLGCGGGEDVRVCHKSMRDQGYDVHVTGIERLRFLCWNAESECHSIRETTSFLCEDAHNSAGLIRQHRQKPEGITIVVAEDFLVQQVLPGPYSGLKILQQLIQPDIADMVVIGGVHHPLVNHRIASAAGWSVEGVRIYHSDSLTGYFAPPELNEGKTSSTPAFVLTRPDLESEWIRLQQKGLRRSTKVITDGVRFQFGQFMKTLDLSMAGLPNQGLNLFLDQKKSLDITQVDLSYAHLDEYQLDKTINLLLGFPSLVHVMVSGFEPWYEAFLQATKTTGRFKLVLRKDNQYRHELPALDPGTAKLLGQYKVIPNERVYAPEPGKVQSPPKNTPAWTADIDSGYLSPELLPTYQKQLLEILLSHNIQLQETTPDGLCFFHAMALQLHIHESELRAALYNHLVLNQQEIQISFPQFAGEQFTQLMAELLQGVWGDAGQAQLAAWVFNRRIILLYFHSQTGGVQVQVLNPDGSVQQSETLPEDFTGNDIVLTHNGQGHWLGAGGNAADTDLQQNNMALLHIQNPIAPPENWMQKLFLADIRYTPELFPRLIALLITAWQTNLK